MRDETPDEAQAGSDVEHRQGNHDDAAGTVPEPLVPDKPDRADRAGDAIKRARMLRATSNRLIRDARESVEHAEGLGLEANRPSQAEETI